MLDTRLLHKFSSYYTFTVIALRLPTSIPDRYIGMPRNANFKDFVPVIKKMPHPLGLDTGLSTHR